MLSPTALSALNPNHCSHSLALITIFSGFKNNPNHHTQFLTLNTIHRSLFTISLALLIGPLEKFCASFVSNFTWRFYRRRKVSKEELNFHDTFFWVMGENKV